MQELTYRRLVPVLLLSLLLGLVLTAALAPVTGLAAADSSCQYNNCSSSPSFWQTDAGYATIAGIVIVVVLAGIIGVYMLRGGKGGSTTETTENPPESGEGVEGGTVEGENPDGGTMEGDAGQEVPPADPNSVEETLSNLEEVGNQ
jgi:hypothetical protein